MNFDRILTSVPVNGAAARVVSRRKGLEQSEFLTREELIEIANRLERKIRLLKTVLGITTKAQHKNLIYRLGKGRFAGVRFKSDPRSAVELKRCGEEKQRITTRIAELNVQERERLHPQWTEEEKAAFHEGRAA